MRIFNLLPIIAILGCSTPDPEGECATTPEEYPAKAASGLVSWPEECRTVKLHCDFKGMQGLSQSRLRQLTQQACKNCSSASGLTVILTSSPSEANILLKCEPLATRGGPLAIGGYPSDCADVVLIRLNANVYWTPTAFLDIMAHELGHAFGMPHTTQTRDIMYPVLKSGRNINGKYGPHFSGPEMVKRYGPRF